MVLLHKFKRILLFTCIGGTELLQFLKEKLKSECSQWRLTFSRRMGNNQNALHVKTVCTLVWTVTVSSCCVTSQQQLSFTQLPGHFQ